MEHKTANAKVLLLPNNLTNSKQQHFGNISVIRASDVASTMTQIGRDGSFTIHERNIQTLGIELYKVAYGIAPQIMRLVFPTRPHVKYPWQSIIWQIYRNKKVTINRH